MAERCNCDASCGENRYHNVGESGCRFSSEDEYNAYWSARRAGYNTEARMSKVNKIADKLAKVNESFTVNMYDNGFMIEIGGKDKKDDWKTAKIMVGSIDELVTLIKEAAAMERDN